MPAPRSGAALRTALGVLVCAWISAGPERGSSLELRGKRRGLKPTDNGDFLPQALALHCANRALKLAMIFLCLHS